MTVNSRTNAARLLSEYLSVLLRAEIVVPPLVDDQKSVKGSVGAFLDSLPAIVQRAVDGAELVFALPLVAQGKGTSLTPQVAWTVNALLRDDGPSDVIDVPTFFYSDGSTMVLTFSKSRLGNALTMLTESEKVLSFVTNALSGPRA
jgi:hypothetical protein